MTEAQALPRTGQSPRDVTTWGSRGLVIMGAGRSGWEVSPRGGSSSVTASGEGPVRTLHVIGKSSPPPRRGQVGSGAPLGGTRSRSFFGDRSGAILHYWWGSGLHWCRQRQRREPPGRPGLHTCFPRSQVWLRIPLSKDPPREPGGSVRVGGGWGLSLSTLPALGSSQKARAAEGHARGMPRKLSGVMSSVCCKFL